MFLTLAVGAFALLTPLQQDTTVSVSPGTRLELSTHTGEIIVRTWNRNAIQVSADLPDDERLEVDVSGGVAQIRRSSRHGGDDESVDFHLTVPVWMELELSTVENGDITIENTQARVTATSVEGNVTIRGGKDFVSAHSVEGDISVNGTTGRVEANSVDGSITVTDVRGEVLAETVDGDITLDGIQSADVEANTVDGNILYRGTVSRSGRYRLGSHDGDITLEVPQLDADISVSTYDGDFQSCGYPVTIGPGDRSKRRFRATVGSGGANVDLESFDGNIYLTKTGCK